MLANGDSMRTIQFSSIVLFSFLLVYCKNHSDSKLQSEQMEKTIDSHNDIRPYAIDYGRSIPDFLYRSLYYLGTKKLMTMRIKS